MLNFDQILAFDGSVLIAAAAVLITFVIWMLSSRNNEKRGEVRQGADSSPIGDNFSTLQEVQGALRHAGLESSNLIIGVDFTKSNTWTGERSFGGRSLHALDPDRENPYQAAIRVVGRTLEEFDDDGLVPAYGFGDRRTTDKSLFPLAAGGAPCAGFDAVLRAYEAAAAGTTLSGPTSFVPLIRRAVQHCRERGGGEFHILLIVADGQVSDARANAEAIVEASQHPLSIVMVGVGDGPWDEMRRFDDELPLRQFDNFQFVCMEDVFRRSGGERGDAAFALAALMEVPEQYKAIRRLGLLSGGASAAAAPPPIMPSAPPALQAPS